MNLLELFKVNEEDFREIEETMKIKYFEFKKLNMKSISVHKIAENASRLIKAMISPKHNMNPQKSSRKLEGFKEKITRKKAFSICEKKTNIPIASILQEISNKNNKFQCKTPTLTIQKNMQGSKENQLFRNKKFPLKKPAAPMKKPPMLFSLKAAIK